MTTNSVETNQAILAEEGEMMVLLVKSKTEIAQDIFLFELGRRDNADLPPFTAGSHLLVLTPRGVSRRYSLCNASSERHRYVIAVKRDAAGGGGSVSMIDSARAGEPLHVSKPLNYFPLAETASNHLLIAGGIGITPALAMMHELSAKGADFQLIYCTRSPETTAFLNELSAPEFAGRVTVHHDYGDRAQSLDLAPFVAQRSGETHLYCCGPRPLMEAVREQTKHWPHTSVHFEDFGTSAPTDPNGEKLFSVRLAKSGKTVAVAPGVSILAAVREQGVTVPSSCESGTCGACRTGLISGAAEHRDFVLDDDEQETEIMICVSRSRGEELVLDL